DRLPDPFRASLRRDLNRSGSLAGALLCGSGESAAILFPARHAFAQERPLLGGIELRRLIAALTGSEPLRLFRRPGSGVAGRQRAVIGRSRCVPALASFDDPVLGPAAADFALR